MQEEFRAIRPDESEECLDLWEKTFGSSTRGYFALYFRDPRFQRECTRVCSVDGRLVSAVQVCERRVRVGQADLKMGGIANVATLPDYRGKGYSSHLLRDAIRVMRVHGMDFSMLFTEIHPFYAKLGWTVIPIPNLRGRIRARLEKHRKNRYTVRRADWERDIENIREIYDAFNCCRPVTVYRTPDYWESYARPRFSAPEATSVAEYMGRVVGYVNAVSEGAECRVQEIGYVPGHEACGEALLRHAAASARAGGAETTTFRLPAEPAIVASAKKIVDGMEVKEFHGMMCRVIDIGALGQKLLPEFNYRADRNVLPSGAVSLDTEMGSLELTVEGQSVSLGMNEGAHVSVSQDAFFSLLFGFKSVDELGISMRPDTRQILCTLFPPRHPIFWEPDRF